MGESEGSFAGEKRLQGAIENRLEQNDVGRLLDGMAKDGQMALSPPPPEPTDSVWGSEAIEEESLPASGSVVEAEEIEHKLSRLGFSELLRLNDFALWIMRDGDEDTPDGVCWAYTERYSPAKGASPAGAPETAIFVLGRGNQPEFMRLTNGALLNMQADQVPGDAATVAYQGGHEIEDSGGSEVEILIGSALDNRAFASRLASELFAGVGETRRRVLFAAGKA